MPPVAIAFDRTCKTYQNLGTRARTALDELTLEVRAGEVFGFLGPNGAGKSTAIKILLDLIFPSGGRVAVLGRRASENAVRRRVGYLPEHPYVYDHLTPEELLWFGGKTVGLTPDRIRGRTDDLLVRVGLAHVRRQRIRTFSKGMVQRACLAMALVHDPELLIFDEPMSGLDPLGRRLIAETIRRLKDEGKTIFFSSHILPDVEDLCDRVGIIVQGKLRRVAELPELLSSSVQGWTITLKGKIDASWAETYAGEGQTIVQGKGLTEVHTLEKDLYAALEPLKRSGGEVVSAAPVRRTLEEIVLREVAAVEVERTE